MEEEFIRPFESIESALEFMVLLEQVSEEVSGELQQKLQQAKMPRYINGLNLALYKVHQLSFHVQKSRRILNDLRLLRTVLTADSVSVVAE
jgi:hypothetical protein